MSRSRLLALGAFLALFLTGFAAPAFPAALRGDISAPLSRCTTTIATVTSTVVSTVVSTVTVTDTTGTTPAPTTTPAPPPSSVIADEGRQLLGGSTAASNLDKYALIELGSGSLDYSSVNGDVLRYSTGAQCVDGVNTEIDKATCRANGWLVHNGSGGELAPGNSSGLMANMGNAGFQNAIKNKILGVLAANPFVKGIYFDNFVCDAANFGFAYPFYTQSGALLWSNYTDFQNSQISFIANVGAALKASGYQVDVNAKCFHAGDPASNYADPTNAWMDRYAAYVTRMKVEYWQQHSSQPNTVYLSGDTNWDRHWNNWQTVQTHAQALGLGFTPLDYISSTELAQCRYLRASFLMEWDGAQGQEVFTPWGTTDIWNTCTAYNPGQPTGAKQQLQTGVWRRDFANGYVLINTTTGTVTIGSDTVASGDAVLR